ncbi:MAG: hypothetical protein WEG36_01610 [Gemmatimonadota bacterium]
MTLAFCADPRFRAHVEVLTPPLAVTDDWDTFEHTAHRAATLIVVTESLRDWSHLDSMRRLRARLPGVPWILLTGRSERNLLELRRFEVEEVVFTTELERLEGAIRGVRVRKVRSTLAKFVSEHEGFTRYKKRLLRALFEANEPPRSCSEWGKLAHVAPDTVKYHFRHVKDRGGPPASFLLNANLVLAALESAPAARSWSELSAVVNVDSRRLHRAGTMLTQNAGQSPAAPLPSIQQVAKGLGQSLSSAP